MIELCRKIAGGLAGKGRIGRAEALALWTVANRARWNPPRLIAVLVKSRRTIPGGAASRKRHGRIISRHQAAMVGIELPGDPAHLPVPAPPVPERLELPFEIACIEAG